MKQTLSRLATVFIPPVILGYGIWEGAVWAQNLFTGWVAFMAVFGPFFFVAFAVMAREDPEKIKEMDAEGKFPPKWDWVRVCGRITSVLELGVVVAMGWWWAAILYAWGWAWSWANAYVLHERVLPNIDDYIEKKEKKESVERAIEKTVEQLNSE